MEAILALVDQAKAGNQDSYLHPLFLHGLGELSYEFRDLRSLQKRVDFTGDIEDSEFGHIGGIL